VMADLVCGKAGIPVRSLANATRNPCDIVRIEAYNDSMHRPAGPGLKDLKVIRWRSSAADWLRRPSLVSAQEDDQDARHRHHSIHCSPENPSIHPAKRCALHERKLRSIIHQPRPIDALLTAIGIGNFRQNNGCADAIVCAQVRCSPARQIYAFHWFANGDVLKEFARVLNRVVLWV
jgi:hypothetical protein